MSAVGGAAGGVPGRFPRVPEFPAQTLDVHPSEIARLTSEQLQLPLISADDVEPDPMLLASLDPDLVRDARAFPIEIDAGRLQHLVAVHISDTNNTRELAVDSPLREIVVDNPKTIQLEVGTLEAQLGDKPTAEMSGGIL